MTIGNIAIDWNNMTGDNIDTGGGGGGGYITPKYAGDPVPIVPITPVDPLPIVTDPIVKLEELPQTVPTVTQPTTKKMNFLWLLPVAGLAWFAYKDSKKRRGRR